MDYPTNVDGRQTLTGYQVRVNSSGNIVADPHTGILYVTFSDNRDGTHDSATPVTNTDVFVVSSTDGGATWSAPVAVDSSSTDQWFPWADVSPVDGTLGVAFNDRSLGDPSLYDATLAESTGGGFGLTTVSTASSHPTDSLFFQAGVTGCETYATFHGDYIGLAFGSDGVANVAWTDMRDQDPALGAGYQQFVYVARVP